MIQSPIDNNAIGIISKVSQNAHRIFSYPSAESMVGMDVNKLLPRCIRDEHKKIMYEWIENGKFNIINRLQ
jgi:hypothetical protein